MTASALIVSASANAVAVSSPFAYPQSLLAGNPEKGSIVTSGITLGETTVSLEKTPIRSLAKILGASLSREGTGDFTRDWTCLETANFRIWLIASDSPTVTEVQMATKPVKAERNGRCYKLPPSFASASIGGVTPGMMQSDVLEKFGRPSYSGEDGWLFWARFKTIEEYSNSRIQMNWTGVQLIGGSVSKIFSSQVTNP